MPTYSEVVAVMQYCIGKGANIGCGDQKLLDSIGVDISPTAKAATVFANAWDLPFESNSLDYIAALACLEHIDRGPIMVLREWTRCVKVGGRVIVLVPDAAYGIWSMTGDRGICGALVKPRREMEHLHAFTQEALKQLFTFTGLRIEANKVIDRRPVRMERTLLCVGIKTEAFIE